MAPIFAQWIEPLKDLGVTTITLRNTGGTDHEAFDAIGIPGFQFIQDPLDYESRTHHSNMDVYEELAPETLAQAAVVEATFVYNAAMRDQMLPRKPRPHPELEEQLKAPLRNIMPGAEAGEAHYATITLYQAGNSDGARQLVLSNAGLFTMEKIRALAAEMQRQETAFDAARTQKYIRSIRLTVACIYLASALAAIGLILLAYFILREMTLRETHAAQIRQREEWFRVTLTSLGDAVIATNEHGVATFMNPVAERLTGRSLAQAKGKAIAEIFPIFNELTRQPVNNPVRKVMELGCIVGLANHTVLQHTDGRLIPIEDSAAPIHDDEGRLVGVVLVFRDATHERESQEILRKTEKLAAAARLAATVAHEINNPLEAVGNLIYLAKARPNLPPEAVCDLELAEQELERVSHITRQTLGFYRESKTSAAIDVPALLDSVLKLYSNKLKSKNINLVLRLEDCPPVLGWPGEVKQLIANLISNAADAMDTRGTLKIEAHCVEQKDGQAVRIRVEDDGPGIAPEDRKRIFEPFFTTKKDVGTGLGLWVAKEIAQRHGGTIEVESRCGEGLHGTVFTVLLPCSADQQDLAAEAV
jgi:PAS domain S-box-containing protein